jgi:tetratricopeptide (TPR) repeat protein
MRNGLRMKLADVYLRNNCPALAAEQFEALVRDDPTEPLGYYYLGAIALDEKKTEQAADYFSKAVLLNPELEQGYHDLARAQLILGRIKEALDTLEKARAKFGGTYVGEFLTGMACLRQKDYSEAIKHYIAAEIIGQASNPKKTNEFLFFQLGSAYEREGDAAQAEKYFQKALVLSPDFADALNYLGYMWAERGENLGKARELIEKAVKLEPKNAAYLDSLGWVLFKLNRPQQALGYLQKAVEFAEEPDPTLFDHLGDVYTALGQKEKAVEAWRKSLSLEPNEQIQKKLGQSPPN